MRLLFCVCVLGTSSLLSTPAWSQPRSSSQPDWQQWSKQNPTYPSLQQPPAVAPTAPAPTQAAPTKAAPASTQPSQLPPGAMDALQKMDRDQFTKLIADSCTAQGAPATYCTCFAQTLMNQYSLEEVVRVGWQFNQTGQFPPELVKIAQGCLAKAP